MAGVSGTGGVSWQQPGEGGVSHESAAGQKTVHRGEPPVPFLRINAVEGRNFQGPGRWQSSFFRTRPLRDISLGILLCALTWAPLLAQEGALGTGPSLKSPHRGTSVFVFSSTADGFGFFGEVKQNWIKASF